MTHPTDPVGFCLSGFMCIYRYPDGRVTVELAEGATLDGAAQRFVEYAVESARNVPRLWTPDTPMIRRVARAIYEEFAGEDGYAELPEHGKARWNRQAIAAILAMRDPTEEMEVAAVYTHPRDLKLGTSIAIARWQAMIDAAMK